MNREKGSYDSVSELVETLDLQVNFYQAQPDDRLLIGLQQLLIFLERDSRQSTLLTELKSESDRAFSEFESQGKRLRLSLAGLWQEVKPFLLVARAIPANSEGEPSGDFEGFERALGRDEEIDTRAYLYRDEPTGDTRLASDLLCKFREWISSAMRAHRKATAAAPEELSTFDGRLGQLKEELDFSWRRHWLDGRALAGNAYQRLTYAARWTNPTPEPSEVSERWEHFGHIYPKQELLEALYGLSTSPSHEAQRALAETAQQVRRDIALVHLQLRSRIVMTHSHLGLLKRFAARCEKFDADRLRQRALKNAKKAEDELRGELARFLFDHGFNPLLDAPLAGLRPDILDARLGRPVYVEAKWYVDKREREQFIKGFRQVLDTRGRLSNTFRNLEEVFLVVFRLGGKRVEFPEVVHVPGGVIYTVLADLDPRTAGSRQKQPPLLVTESDLLDR
jgi:hypothetical protein